MFNTHGFHLLHEVLAEDSIAIPQQIAWRGLPGKRFMPLLCSPLRRRMGGHAKVDNPPPIVCLYMIWNRIVGAVKKSTDTIVFR